MDDFEDHSESTCARVGMEDSFKKTGKVIMRVKIEEIGTGQHPSEKVVKVETRDGPEQLVVDGRSIHDHSLDVGYPVGQHMDTF